MTFFALAGKCVDLEPTSAGPSIPSDSVIPGSSKVPAKEERRTERLLIAACENSLGAKVDILSYDD